MTTSNRLFGTISAIYMGTAQNPIFWLLRIYYFPTANITIIYLLQIEQLFQQWKSSKYLISVHRKIVYDNFNCLFGNISTIYMATAQSSIFWLLRIYYFPTAHLPIICVLQIDQQILHW